MYLGSNEKYKFHALEIRRCTEEKLLPIARACEKVELDVWNACENFMTYLKKQSALLYATHEDEIVGFALFDVSIESNRLIVLANECMVLNRHHGKGLPTIFAAILTAHIRRDNKRRGAKRAYKYVTFISATVNFKLMNAFKNYDWLTVASTFKPDEEILLITKNHLKKENYSLVDPNDLFFIKNAFPNAVKSTGTIKSPDFVPTGFQPRRGDAFLYVCRIRMFWLLGLMAKWSHFRYGFKFSKDLIPLDHLSRDEVVYSR